MTEEERKLLVILDESKSRGAYTACDGKDRAPAHSLERQGLAKWMGTSWGSYFYAITEQGAAAL